MMMMIIIILVSVKKSLKRQALPFQGLFFWRNQNHAPLKKRWVTVGVKAGSAPPKPETPPPRVLEPQSFGDVKVNGLEV